MNASSFLIPFKMFRNPFPILTLLTLLTFLPLSASLHAQTYSGPTSGTQTWNNSANWTPATVPNSAGASVTVSSATATLTLVADGAAATNITFGDLTTTMNQTVQLGSTTVATDLGSFTINNSGGATWAVGAALNTGRGINLAGNKDAHFTLASDLTVNLNAGSNTGRRLAIFANGGITGSNAALDGGGNTITLNGGFLQLGASGADGRPVRNVILDVRNAETTALSFEGNAGVTATDVTLRIGNSGGQDWVINGTNTFDGAVNLYGNVKIRASGNRGLNLNGVISDASGSNRITYETTGTAGLNVSIAGSLGANTYSGGTTVNLAGSGTNRTVTATKAGAFGTGDLEILAGRVTLGGNQTVAGLSGSSVGELVGNNASATRILTLNQASGSFNYAGTIGFDTDTARRNVAIVKEGAGIQIFSGNNTYTGGTTVNAGTLLFNSSTAAGTGNVTVASGARVGGSGTIAGNLTLSSGAQFVFDPATTLTVIGSVTLPTTFSISSLVTSAGAAIDWTTILDGTYTLIANSTDFSSISNFGLANAADIGGGRLAYFQNGSLELVVVPEPSTYLLLGLGLGALVWLRRRK